MLVEKSTGLRSVENQGLRAFSTTTQTHLLKYVNYHLNYPAFVLPMAAWDHTQGQQADKGQ